MKNKILIMSLIVLAIFIMFVVNFPQEDTQEIIMEENKQLFQGPIPEGYDEEHFRKTGETIKLEK